MDGTNMEELRELVAFLKASGIAEFEMERTDLKVRLKFEGKEPQPAQASFDLARLSQMVASTGVASAPASAPLVDPAGLDELTPITEPAAHEVRSPIVGTFYESPSPGAPAFVKIGDQVEVGQVLCIIEAMKLMNEIESDLAGEVMQRIAVSGQPVEYGQPLFAIKPR